MNLARRAPEGAAESAIAHSAGPWESFVEGWRRFVVSSCIVRQLVQKTNNNGTDIDQKWDRSGPKGRQWVPRKQHKYEKVKNMQTQKNNMRKHIFFEMWGELLKNRRAQRLGVYYVL